METIKEVKKLIKSIDLKLFDRKFTIRVDYDNEWSRTIFLNHSPNIISGRIFIQIQYTAKCTKSGKSQKWSGRKWYLSSHMTKDEVIKTCYGAFKAAVEHEMMEGFSIGGVILFNPHVNYKELIKISNKEIRRS